MKKFETVLFLLEYNIEIKKHLDDKSLKELLNKYLEDKSIELRNKLLENFYGLLLKLANKYAKNMHDRDDLISIGVQAFIKALENYDPVKSKGKFKSYLFKSIQGEMLKYFNTKFKKHVKGSLDKLLGREDSDDQRQSGYNFIQSPEEDVSNLVDKRDKEKMLYKALSKLDDKEKRAIEMYYGIIENPRTKDFKSLKNRYTFDEIGKELGMTKMGAKKLFDRAFQKLQKLMKAA